MQLTKIEIKNFRCFTDLSVDLGSRLILIAGDNGTGKTSLLEALHYLCYLRSFRTHSPRELLKFDAENFFIKAYCEQKDGTHYEVQIGFSGKKKLVKVNQKSVHSYKELVDYYRIVTVTEDDLSLITGSPEKRRIFIDQAILLKDPEFLAHLKELRQVADRRTVLLSRGTPSVESYHIWSEQLWLKSVLVQARRSDILAELESIVQGLIRQLDLPYLVTFVYTKRAGAGHETWEAFYNANPDIYTDELRVRHSLFGAHLDDIAIHIHHKKTKAFASRGQQKLIMVLLKIAQLQQLAMLGLNPVFLLDDFMTDFDEKVMHGLLSILLNLESQLIFTTPAGGGIEGMLMKYGALKVRMGRNIDT